MNAELFDPIDPETSDNSSDENRRSSTRFTVGAREVPAKLVVGMDQFPAFLQDWSTSGFRLLVDNVDRWQALEETPTDCFIDVWGSRFAVRYVREYPERSRLCVCFEQKSEGYNPGAMAIPLLDDASWQSGGSFVGAADEFSPSANVEEAERRGDDRVHPAAMVCAGVAMLALAASLFVGGGSGEQPIVAAVETPANEADLAATDAESTSVETHFVATELPEDAATPSNIATGAAFPKPTANKTPKVKAKATVASRGTSAAAEKKQRAVAKKPTSKRTPAPAKVAPTMLFVNGNDSPAKQFSQLRRELRAAPAAVTLMVPVPLDENGRATQLVLKELTAEMAGKLARYLDAGRAESIDDVLSFINDSTPKTALR